MFTPAKDSTMQLEVLQSLDKMSLTAAQESAIKLIDPKKTKKIVMNRLMNDIEKAPSAAEVSRIMWQVYLSGNGMPTIGSKWKKHYY